MKKLTLISSLFIITAIIVLLALTQTQVESKNNPQGNYVKFTVMNCDNCSNISYCIDGGTLNYISYCSFGWDDCSVGNHSIFVQCGTKTGSANFYCYGGDPQFVEVTVISGGPANPCSAK